MASSFDPVNHDILMGLVAKRVTDKRIQWPAARAPIVADRIGQGQTEAIDPSLSDDRSARYVPLPPTLVDTP